MSRTIADLTGQTIGKWSVLYEVEPRHTGTDNHLRHFWYCRCECGNEREVSHRLLIEKKSLSCGCRGIEIRRKICQQRKSINIFIIKNDYCIVQDNLRHEFLIDIKDIEKVKERYWYVIPSSGYVYSHNKGSKESSNSKISLHEYLTGQRYVDHINHNTSDCRRCNLRYINDENSLTTNQGYNNYNRKLRSDNTSGVTGVNWISNNNKWHAYIIVNRKNINLGYYSDKNEAIKARKNAELIYTRNYDYDSSREIANNNNIIREV